MAEKTEDDPKSATLKDEPECEGLYDRSVKDLLKKNGYPIDDRQFLEMHLLQSTTFDPQAYMAHVHRDTPIELLRSGLDNLEQSMAQKSGSLKKLVESNFERFVRAKSTLDDVHTAMRNQGLEPGEVETRRPHSRHASRGSNHFRNTSGAGLYARGKTQTNEKRKLALVKESEFGVQGIKGPLTEAAAKAEEVYNPALNSRERVKLLQELSSSLEECKDIIDLIEQMSQAIENKDYDKVVSCYNSSMEAKATCQSYAKEVERSGSPMTDQQVRRCVITAKVLLNLEHQLEGFKREVWRDLTSVQANLTMSTDRSRQDDYIAMLGVLLSLGVEDNPIWVWLLSRYDYLKNKINSTFERSRVEIEVFRRRLANTEKPSGQASAAHYKAPLSSVNDDRYRRLDTAAILELWDIILHSLGNLLSVKGGVLGEVLDFWDKAQSFIKGQAQKSLPVGYDGSGQKHHFLSADDIKALQDGATELVELLREQVLAFFTEPPVEDVSLLFSPNPESPNSPKSPGVGGLSPFIRSDRGFNLDPTAPPPPSPKTGEAWEKYAFWPPYANALSGVHYLGRILAIIGTAAAHMSIVGSSTVRQTAPERLRLLVNAVRDRSSKAICAAWEHDAETSKVLEDWTRESTHSDTTCWPARFQALESFIVSGVQQVLYISEATGTKDAPTSVIIVPPNSTLQNSIRKTFTNTIYLGLNAMVENVAQPAASSDNPWASDGHSAMDERLSMLSIRDAYDTSLKGPRMLLTLSNLGALSRTVIPSLVSEFETAFSMTLTDDVQRLNDMLTKFDQRMFRYYVSPISADVSGMISNGISSPAWAATSTANPTAVSSFVYPALLRLVAVHSEIANTAPSYVTKILRHLLEDASRAFLDAFRRRGRFPLAALVQATLDLEFFAQTLSQYATEGSGAIQTDIYAVLDQGTDAQSRQQLQSALASMKGTLKTLREGSKAQFQCFRRQKKESTSQL